MSINFKQLLNNKQYEAVSTIDGPLLILAGAGSGKTRVITYRTAYLLQKGIPQSSIIGLTFTNKSAREMSKRIRELTSKPLRNLTISTFHSFGVKILRDTISTIGYKPVFSIYDQQDKHSLLKELVQEYGFSRDSIDLNLVANLFSGIKTGRLSWNKYTEQYKELFSEYLNRLKLFNAVDFDDLIVLPIKIFKKNPSLLKKYHDIFSYFMVDEFQDTSTIQYEFIKNLAIRSKNLCVVGDDDQSIYSWRGANYKNILRFEKDFPSFKEIKLEQNYRSTGNILFLANNLILNNKNRKIKTLWTGIEEGDKIKYSILENEKREGEFIVEQIKSLKMKKRMKNNNFGVLVRTNSLTRPIEEAFLRNSIPYKVSGGLSFFNRKEVRDILSYLKIIINPDNDLHFIRIINTPRRGIGKKTLQYIIDIANKKACSLYSAVSAICHAQDARLSEKVKIELNDFFHTIEYYKNKFSPGKNMAESLTGLINKIEYRDYLIQEYKKRETVNWKYLNVEGLINSLADFENDPDIVKPNLYSYLNRITLLSRDDNQNTEDEDKVNLMTIHSAKGLEFEVVFIAGVEETIIPHSRSISENELNIEEERRLFYVAITRAKKYLFLTSCKQRRKMGGITECTSSPFTSEIPEELLEYYLEDDYVEQNDAEDYFSQIRSRIK